MTEKDDSKGLHKILVDILSSTEEVKSLVSPLIRGHEHAMNALKSQQEAISNLMASVLGTKEDHRKMADKLEMVSGKFSAFQQKIESHESFNELLDKRMTLIENQQVQEISEQVLAGKTPSKVQLQTLEGLIGVHPKSYALMALKADALIALGEEDKALKWIDDSIARHQKEPYLWWEKGVVLAESDKEYNKEEAIKCFDKSVELLRDDERKNLHHLIFYSKALVLEELRRFEEALTSAEKAVEYEPKCDNAWSEKGDLLYELNRIPESLGCYEKALEVDPKSGWAWFGKGQALAILGSDHYKEAVACFDKSINLNPMVASAYFSKARVLLCMDQMTDGLEAVEKGLSLDPKDACAWCHKGMLLASLDQFPKAVDSFNRAIELGPEKCVDVFSLKGQALIDAGQISDARSWLKDIDDKRMSGTEMLNGHAYALYEVGEFGRGVEVARRVIDIDSGSSEFWDTLACNLAGERSDQKGLDAFRKAVELAKDDRSITWDEYSALCDRMALGEEAVLAKKKLSSSPPNNS